MLVSYNERRGAFEIDGDDLANLLDGQDFVLCRERAYGLGLTALQAGLRDYEAETDESAADICFLVSDTPARYWQGDDSLAGPVSLYFENDSIHDVAVSVGLHASLDVDDEWPEMESFLAIWTRAWPVVSRKFEQVEWSLPVLNIWQASYSWTEASATVSEVIEYAYALRSVAGAYSNSEFSADMVLALLRAGMPSALLGLRETGNLDVKRSLILETDSAVHEAAKDVAAMANTDRGGSIVVGLATRRHSGGDLISRLTPVRDGPGLERRLWRVVSDNVYPAIDGLAIESHAVESDNGSVVIVHIPPQDPGVRPFLVVGSSIDDKVSKTYFSVPVRIGEDTTYMSAAAIHSAIVIGRALLSGRVVYLPSDRPEPRDHR